MIVVDSSALVALIKNEPGGDVLLSHMGNMVISAVNFSECVKILQESTKPDLMTSHALTMLVSEIVAFDGNSAIHAANLHLLTKSCGLSLGDRACIALGMQRKLPIYTADKIWSKCKLQADIRVIR